MSDDSDYQDLLLEHGIGVPVDPDVIAKLCRRLLSSAKSGLSGDDVNLVAAAVPEVAQVVSNGVMHVDDGSFLLVLPPISSVIDAVRDALWFEFDSGARSWAQGTRAILSAMRNSTNGTDLALGPRSTICHQDKVVAGTMPGVMFKASGAHSDATFGEHGHDDWLRVRVQAERSSGFPDPSFLVFDLCAICGETTNSTARLGLAIVGACPDHEHEWSDFTAPVPDAKGIMGVLEGEVCVARCGVKKESVDRPGRCLVVRDARLTAKRKTALPPLPSWVRKDRSILRRVLAFPRSHKHLWTPGRVALGGAASLMIVRCVLCDAEFWSNKIAGESVPDLMRELRRRVKAAGGFARASAEDLRGIRADMRPKWGPYLGWFGDALSMIVCASGELREATEEERERAASIVERGRAM